MLGAMLGAIEDVVMVVVPSGFWVVVVVLPSGFCVVVLLLDGYILGMPIGRRCKELVE